MNKFSLIAVLCLGFTGVANADGDAAAGQQKASACAACHGPNGNSANGQWPSLAGQNADYLVKQLKNFKAVADESISGPERNNPIMVQQASALSEQDMMDIAAYYEEQEIQRSAVPDQYIALGKRLYRAGDADEGIPACAACHGPAGDGIKGAKFPSLAGQQPEYTIAQLKAFRKGERHNDPNSMMRNVAARMTDEQIEALAYYLVGLH